MREPILAKILRYIIYAAAFMPLIIFSQFISPFHFGKVVVFRSIVELMVVGYLLLLWQDRSYRPKTNIIFWALLAFVAAFSVTTLASIQPYASFWGTLERMGGLWTFFHYFLFFIIATAVLRKQEHWETFLTCTIATAILSALYGFGQKTNISFFIGSGGRERIFGTIGNAALFAGYEIVNIFLALTLLLRPNNSQFKKIVYGTGVVLGSLAVTMTVVRGSLLGLGAGLLMFSLWYFLKTNSRKAKLVLLSLATVASLFVVILITPLKDASFIGNSKFLRRVTDTSFESFTAKTRFWAWQAGLKGWSESPRRILLGWGPENFNIPFSKYFNPKFFTGYGAETLFDRAHNMFVEVLVTMGLIGFITYVGIFFFSFRALRTIRHAQTDNYIYTIGLSSLIVAYAIHNAFIFDTSANLLVFFTILGFIAFLLMRGKDRDITASPQPVRINPALRFIVGSLLAITALVLIYRTNIIPSKANYASTRGIIAGWANDFSGAVVKFTEAMNYNVPGRYEIRHRFGQYLLEYSGAKQQTPEVESAVKLAIDEITKNRDENPADYLPLLYLSRLNINLGRGDAKSPYNDIALQHSLRALEISPTFIRTFYEIGQGYLNKKDYESAIKYFKQAAELNPEVGLSYWYWGIVEITRGNPDKGLRVINMALDRGYAPSESDYLNLAQQYVARKDYQALADIYERLVKLNPKNSEYYTSLAVAYANLGRVDDALAMARKAVTIDPSLLPSAQEFARELGREL